MEFRLGLFELVTMLGVLIARSKTEISAGLSFLFGLMDTPLLHSVGVMAPRIVFRQLVKQPIYDFKRRADAVQGRGQPVHSIYRMCG